MYIPVNPSYSFDRVILPDDVKNKIKEALSILQYERKVFDEWGLYEIQPRPSSSMSFFGPSGTGKTMAAEAIAQKLGKKILKVSYADVESKYHGEGPKMVKAIFVAADRDDAVLFFDEADSLLSKRLTNVSQGSEQAINSMRSQLLICLEEFKGIVIFATNLVINYDHAFLTRLISVKFVNPDCETRKKIWNVHIKPTDDGKQHKLNIPLADDVDTTELAEKYDFVGREIRNAVISACVSAAMNGKEIVNQNDFIVACDKIVKEKLSLTTAKDNTKDSRTEEIVKQALIQKIKGDAADVSKITE
jgi:SpoVK/Ycf46/Vps4 family AAA+-type ATPase